MATGNAGQDAQWFRELGEMIKQLEAEGISDEEIVGRIREKVEAKAEELGIDLTQPLGPEAREIFRRATEASGERHIRLVPEPDEMED